GTIIEANPFMCGLLGYDLGDFLGKELWEIGLFRDKEASRAAYQELLAKGYIRYEHLPLKAWGGDEVEVEFVSNLYTVGDRQVAQLSHLVDDLLEVARFTSGKIRLHPVLLDMRGVVERAVESARPLVDRRRHVLTVDVPEGPIWLHADPARLEQVVVNLLN